MQSRGRSTSDTRLDVRVSRRGEQLPVNAFSSLSVLLLTGLRQLIIALVVSLFTCPLLLAAQLKDALCTLAAKAT